LLSTTPASEVGSVCDIKYFGIKFLQLLLLLYVEFYFFFKGEANWSDKLKSKAW
jgi:hypothetical protein